MELVVVPLVRKISFDLNHFCFVSGFSHEKI